MTILAVNGSSPRMLDFNPYNLPNLCKQLAKSSHRQLLLLCGEREWGLDYFTSLTSSLNKANHLILSDHPHREALWPEHLHQVLGQEHDLVMYDGFSGVFPNKIAAIGGTVKAGGLLVLLLPDKKHWEQWRDPALRKWCSEGIKVKQGYFLARWSQLLSRNTIWSIEQHTGAQLPQHYHHVPENNGIEAQQALQPLLLAALEHGHPTVLSADRGRGKTSLLGQLAAHLAPRPVIICALQFKAVKSAFWHHAQHLKIPLCDTQKKQANLTFIPPDVLLAQQEIDPNAIVLVDEAASIPVPVLVKLVNRFSRILFSSTLVGYEGNGRGYTLRFQRYLTKHFPTTQQFELTTPIRYASNDPLENALRQLFALDAQLPALAHIKQGITKDSPDITVKVISSQALVSNEPLLKSIFALLVMAHYQTSVDDLRQLLDAPDNRLFILHQQTILLGVCLVIEEGGLSDTLSCEVISGNRRPAGHMLSQQLAHLSGDITFLTSRTARIGRIAVHPELQNKHLGSALLRHVVEHYRKKHWRIGSSFGANAALCQFWQKNGFQAVKLGFKKDKASGEYALLVLHNASHDKDLAVQFKHDFFYGLAGHYKQLEPDLISSLLDMLPHELQSPRLLKQLLRLAESPPLLHQAMPIIWQATLSCPAVIKSLPKGSKALFIRLILQHHAQTELQDEFNFKGKKPFNAHLQTLIQTVASTLCCNHSDK